MRADGFDLDHHGDVEVGDGLVDLAVNVRAGTPPTWLIDEISSSLTELAAYPRADAAVSAVAKRHGCQPTQVLLTAGAAEAFVLIARAFRPRHAVVVHPQFTEPEAALRSAGHLVDRVILDPANGFALDPKAIPADADLVVIGNPTNPTSVLHPAGVLRELARPDRILVVDEAFMDAVPGEPESLAGAAIPGLIVIRSLTKTWGLAGLRVGYVLASPALIDQLASVQPHWPVSTPALAAILACTTPAALAESTEAAHALVHHRTHLLTGLLNPTGPGTPLPQTDPPPANVVYGSGGAHPHADPQPAEVVGHGPGAAHPRTDLQPADLVRHGPGGLRIYGEPRAPFVLVHLPGGDALRERLRERGFAVRRGDTFPGLSPDWLRIAVRPEPTTDAFLKTWHDLRA